MDLSGQRRSDNVEDRRGSRGRSGAGLGIGGVIAVVIIGKLLGVDTGTLLQIVGQNQSVNQAPSEAPAQADEMSDLVRAILGSTEDAWGELFQEQGNRYQAPKLVLFRDAVETACGFEQSATGPFYCPADRKVYLDLSFFDLLSRQFGAPGDFAQAYVIGHEVGHHVQNLLGISAKTRAAQREVSASERNALSVKMELQADCFAGVWARKAQRKKAFLQEGDVEEAIKAATAIGDDHLQKSAGRRISPESFTHGSSAQRVEALKRGLQTGSMEACSDL